MTTIIRLFHHDVRHDICHSFRIACNAGRNDRVETKMKSIVGELADGGRYLHRKRVSALNAMRRM